MAALWHARATGEGQYVDVAMTDSILAMSELVVSQYSYRGVSPVPVGNGIPGVAPFGTVKVKDGVIVIAAPHDPQFHALCRLIGMPELIDDPRFANEALRWETHAALDAAIETFTTTRTKLELRALFGGKVPFSPIYNAAGDLRGPALRGTPDAARGRAARQRSGRSRCQASRSSCRRRRGACATARR